MSYVVKKWILWSKFTSSKKVLWFFSKGLRFRILLTVDYKTTYPQVFKSTFCYSGWFFSIRFKSHQVVYSVKPAYLSIKLLLWISFSVSFLSFYPFRFWDSQEIHKNFNKILSKQGRWLSTDTQWVVLLSRCQFLGIPV